MAYFAMFRMLFIVYHHAKIADGQHSETGLSFLYGLRLDLSAACFAAIIPYILWVVQQFNKKRIIHLLNLGYNSFLIIFVSALSILNIKLYGEWDSLLGYRALKHFIFPDEMHKFLSLWSLLLVGFAVAVFAYVGIKQYRKYIINFSYPLENLKLRMAIIIVIPILLVIGFRGGLQNSPINESNSDYSDSKVNNFIATNNVWYFVHTCWDATKDADFNFFKKLP